jgi:hypothetical protein
MGAALSLVLVACGGDDDENAHPTAAQPTATVFAATSPGERAAALCAGSQAGVTPNVVQASEVVEISGLAAGRANPGVLWAHNDSGDTARMIAFTTDGEPRGVYTIEGAEAIDWEDMAIAPIREEATPALFDLFLGDIGDNAAVRTEIVIYRVREPLIAAGAVDRVIASEQRVVLRYPDGARDAETLLADPVTGDLFIVSKELITGNAGVYRASDAVLFADDGAMEKVGEIAKERLTSAVTPPDSASALVRGVGYLPTGGDISRDGALIAIRTYASVFIWARDEGQSVAEALAGTPCEAPSAVEPQGEAIAFAADGDEYFTVSEGALPPLNAFRPESP